MRILLIVLLAIISIDVSANKFCMTEAIYWEARGESLTGQLAVAGVVLNRVKSNRYPNNICSVVRQRKQFSWNSVKNRVIVEKDAWHSSSVLASKILSREVVISSKFTATHFHSIDSNPNWGIQFHAQIGNHIFYFEER